MLWAYMLYKQLKQLYLVSDVVEIIEDSTNRKQFSQYHFILMPT